MQQNVEILLQLRAIKVLLLKEDLSNLQWFGSHEALLQIQKSKAIHKCSDASSIIPMK